MKFGNPVWLLVGLLACITLLWMWRRQDVRQQAALARFVAPHLLGVLTRSVSRSARIVQRGLFLSATICLFLALAGPLLGYHWEQVSRRGNEVVFAIDTSRSMETPDVKPNRLVRAKLAIDDMARQLDGDAVGIVAFAGSAFLVCPLTVDYGAFHESLQAVDIHTIPRGGTNIASAIQEAQTALRRHPDSDKTLILLTDGEDLEGSALAAAQAAAKQDNLKIYTVGVGTAAGDLIPLAADQGGGFVKDETGAYVKSHLDESALQAIASATGGIYAPLGPRAEGLEDVLHTAFGSMTKHDLAYRQQRVYDERYQWPLAASLLLLLSSQLIGSRRFGWRRGPTASAAVASALLLILLLPFRSRGADQASSSPASPVATEANADRAPLIDYNAGTDAYRAGLYPQATQAFAQSIRSTPKADAKRLADQEDAYYNLGNSLYREGQKSEKTAPQDAIKKWTEAVKAYETALQLRPDDADSKYNRDLVKRKIDKLKPPPDDSGGGGGGGGQGKGNGQGQGQGQPPPQGQQPPPAQNQPPPQAQQPPPPQGQPPTAQNQQQQQGQPPPQNQPQQGQQQPPPQPQPQPQNADARQGPPPPPQSASSAEQPAQPGQMSQEEARELLDSAKADEHHVLGAPVDRRDQDDSTDKPFKNW